MGPDLLFAFWANHRIKKEKSRSDPNIPNFSHSSVKGETMLIRALSAVLAVTALASLPRDDGNRWPKTLAGWNAYIAATETRIERELGATAPRFLAQDFLATADADRRAVLAGAIVVSPVETLDGGAREIDVPYAMVHHWRGAVFLPRQHLSSLLAALQNGPPPTQKEDVLKSAVLARGPDRMRVYLQVQRTRFITVVFNTEHNVTFRHFGPSRASSASVATRIAEVENAGTPQEHELPPGQDRGFLWRWNSYWRYEEVAGGVIAECESVSLSRPIPSLLYYAVKPLVDSTARESMERTLIALRSM
jgi:hypothetical protein